MTVNHCHDCNSDYATPGTCNCFAPGGKRYTAPTPTYPYPTWVPYYPYPWWGTGYYTSPTITWSHPINDGNTTITVEPLTVMGNVTDTAALAKFVAGLSNTVANAAGGSC